MIAENNLRNKMTKKLKCWKEHKIDGEVFALSPKKNNKSKIAGYSITDFDGGVSVNEFTKDGDFKDKKILDDKKGFRRINRAQSLMFRWAKRHNRC